jgi:hypothetical protein
LRSADEALGEGGGSGRGLTRWATVVAPADDWLGDVEDFWTRKADDRAGDVDGGCAKCLCAPPEKMTAFLLVAWKCGCEDFCSCQVCGANLK